MQITARELCNLLKGTLEGNPEVVVHKPSKIEEGEAGTISFLANLKYESFAYKTNASILLVSKDFIPTKPISSTLIRVENVYASMNFLLEHFNAVARGNMKGVSKQCSVDSSVKIGENVSVGHFSVLEKGVEVGAHTVIYPQVYIGPGAKIGKHTVLHPGVKIYADCVVGDHCILHSNVVIGSDGFGFLPQADGSFKKTAQIGNVIIESQVEIGANTVIDRATMGSTIIRKGVKLDNLIQIAHNVEIGANTVIAAQAGIAGSTKLGKNCQVGGQVGFVGHIEVADGTKVQAQSGVAASIKKENTAIYGSPALAYTQYLRSYAVFKQLPGLLRKIKTLEDEIKALNSEE